MNNKIVAIFNDTVTGNALSEIESVHKNLIHDFTNEEEFKAARKVNTEMNKLLKEIDRVGIDAAKNITEMRDSFKERVEYAYSGTVTPFKIEDTKRKNEKKRIEDEIKSRIEYQNNKLSIMKSASARAIHLNHDEIEDILQTVMDIDISLFDESLRSEAQLTKDIALSQINDAFKYAQEKEDARKKAELKDAEIADKNDEIEALKAQLLAMQPKKKELPVYDGEELKIAFLSCLFNSGVDNWSGYCYAVEELESMYPGANFNQIK